MNNIIDINLDQGIKDSILQTIQAIVSTRFIKSKNTI